MSASIQKLRTQLLLCVAAGALVTLGLAVWADLPTFLAALASFQWWLIVPIALLTFVNYGLRIAKWMLYTRVVGASQVGWWEGTLLFFAGLSLSLTPGKVGELVKCALLSERSGVPFTRTAPIVVAERLSDGIALVLMAAIGAAAFGVGREFAIAGALVTLGLVAVIEIRPIGLAVLRLCSRLPLIGPRVHLLRELYESSYALFHPRIMTPAVAIGFVAWSLQGVALALTFMGLGVSGGWELVLPSIFVLASAMIAGSLLLVPGGIGVAEASIVGLSQLLLEVTAQVAAVAALITRLCTLWFGVVVGVAAIAIITRDNPLPAIPATAPADEIIGAV